MPSESCSNTMVAPNRKSQYPGGSSQTPFFAKGNKFSNLNRCYNLVCDNRSFFFSCQHSRCVRKCPAAAKAASEREKTEVKLCEWYHGGRPCLTPRASRAGAAPGP